MDEKTEQTEQASPTKFRDLYTRITSHLEQHPDIVIVGRDMEVDTFSDFAINYYVAPPQEMADLDELNRLLQSLQPQDLTPTKVMEFQFTSSIVKIEVTLGVLEYKKDIDELRVMKRLDVQKYSGAQIVLASDALYFSPSKGILFTSKPTCTYHHETLTLDQAISSIDDDSLVKTTQYTAGIKIILFPSKEYATKVLEKKNNNTLDTSDLDRCYLVDQHLILLREHVARIRQADQAQKEQQDKPLTKGLVRRVIDDAIDYLKSIGR